MYIHVIAFLSGLSDFSSSFWSFIISWMQSSQKYICQGNWYLIPYIFGQTLFLDLIYFFPNPNGIFTC